MLVLGLATALVGRLYLSSVAFIPVTVAVVVFYTFPILIVLASPFVEGTRLTPPLLGIAALALAGVVLVVGPAFERPRLARARARARGERRDRDPVLRRGALPAHRRLRQGVLDPPPGPARRRSLIGLAAGSLAPPSNLLLAPLAVAMTVGGYVFGFVLQFLALARISGGRRRHRLLRRAGGRGPVLDPRSSAKRLSACSSSAARWCSPPSSPTCSLEQRRAPRRPCDAAMTEAVHDADPLPADPADRAHRLPRAPARPRCSTACCRTRRSPTPS